MRVVYCHLSTEQERAFWSKVDKSGGDNACWLWTGYANRAGYGQFTMWLPINWFENKSKTMGAHRVAYTLLVGSIPKGLTLDHLCRNPLCCNPAHLEPVTNRVNSMRSNVHLDWPAALARLDAEDPDSEYTRAEAAELLGVKQTTVAHLIRRGELDSHKAGRRVCHTHSALRDFVRSRIKELGLESDTKAA